MQTQSPIQPKTPLPSVQPQWHRMLRRCRVADRRLAMQLCRSEAIRRSGGRYERLGSMSDAELASALQLTSSQTARLRTANSPLWRWEGDTLILFFFGEPVREGQPTPAALGHRLARRERRQRSHRHRELRRRHLQRLYSAADDDGGDCLAAED